MATFKSKVVNTMLAGTRSESVWDGKKIICVIQGTLTTEDKELIAKLKDLGYEEVTEAKKAEATFETPAPGATAAPAGKEKKKAEAK
jgi:hypothetical protein